MTNAARALAQSSLARLYAAAESEIELRGIERDEARDALARMTVLASRWYYGNVWHDGSPRTEIAAAVAGDGWHRCHACSAWTDVTHYVTSPLLTDGDWFCDDCVSTP